MTSECLNISIWRLQCKYSIAVEEYLNNILLGISCDSLPCLLTFKRALQMLSRNAVNYGATTIEYVASHSHVGVIPLQYLDENNEIQSIDIPVAPATITFCAIKDSVTGTPTHLASVTLVAGNDCNTHCDNNIKEAVLEDIICSLNKKYN